MTTSMELRDLSLQAIKNYQYEEISTQMFHQSKEIISKMEYPDMTQEDRLEVQQKVKIFK